MDVKGSEGLDIAFDVANQRRHFGVSCWVHFERSKTDPCLYFRWTAFGLVVIILWVNDLLIGGRCQDRTTQSLG
jgi:hypothetical protein